jgi:hypothetical protein
MELTKYHNKKVKLVLNDFDKVSTRVGLILSSDTDSITVKTQIGTEIIPLNTIIRIEVLE